MRPKAAGSVIPRLLAVGSLAALAGLLGLVVVRTAWVSDDAFITFRTIDNFVHGSGLRWNVTERVQSYTHPLWLLVLTPVVALSGSAYLSAIATSLAFTTVTVAVVAMALRRELWRVGFALIAMIVSKAFTDYATSGLENALSHALLASLMLVTAAPVNTRRRAGLAGALVALIGLSRLDLLLLAVPIAVGATREWRRTIPYFALGLMPLAAWEVFSLVYYGVPFPNTAYAKLATHIPQPELLVQGMSYLFDSLDRDPVTIFVVAGGAGTALVGRTHSRICALAVCAYVVYVLRIGGDFMSGRFLTAPFVVSLCLLGRLDAVTSAVGRFTAVAAVVAVGLSAPRPTLANDASYSTPWQEIQSPSGIVDERGFYFQHTGWLTTHGFRTEPTDAAELRPKLDRVMAQNPRAFVHGTIGLVGYYVGPSRHIVDDFALCDPLLARLPAAIPWRIGHYRRDLPAGYFESVDRDQNVIEDPQIASLYEVIRVVTRGPLWSWTRWRAIIALNTGRTDGWPVAR
ncbi:MAG: hypothetical protein ABI051_13770 [Vicinamibacterales bacterium]